MLVNICWYGFRLYPCNVHRRLGPQNAIAFKAWEVLARFRLQRLKFEFTNGLPLKANATNGIICLSCSGHKVHSSAAHYRMVYPLSIKMPNSFDQDAKFI